MWFYRESLLFCLVALCASESEIYYRDSPLSNRRGARYSESERRGVEATAAPPHPIYDFARNLFLQTAELDFSREENVLISPFSIRAILGLIYLAAKGKTAEEIRDALQFSSEPERLVSALGKHMQQTQTQPGQSFLFKVGNGIFIQQGSSLNKTYVDIVRNKLFSTVIRTDFQNPRKATEEINNWVREITDNRIPDLLAPTSLSPQTSVFFGNALYFSGQWDKPFDGTVPDSESKFLLNSGERITVPMMQIESTFGYAYISKLQSVGISIPFKDHRFEFIILKPDGKLVDLENLMKNYPLNSLASEIKAYTRNVVLKMPKFKLDVNYDLVDVMKQLGINALFHQNVVDLSKVGRTTLSPRLCIEHHWM